jgi:hypothetical protein
MASKVKVNTIETESGSTLTIGQSGDTVTLASGASQSGFGRSGTVDWDTTVKTAAFTAVSGDGYFVNTTSGAITATLPAGSAGAIVAFADYANTFDTNALTITPNGTDKIAGTNANATVTTEGASTTFVYVDSTQGWKQVNDATLNTIGQNFITATGGTITTCGNFKIHTFTSPGTFCVSQIATVPANNEVSYLVVAGGGGGRDDGSAPQGGAGGGAGGYRESKSAVDTYTASPREGSTDISVTATAFPITVGAGGARQSNDGSNSVFSTITSTGGGGGGVYTGGNGRTGGSGGGGGANGGSGGTGNNPPVSPPQGSPGSPAPSSSIPGAGGGAAEAGQGVNGGDGVPTGINPSTCVGTPGSSPGRYFAGGGGGGVGSTSGGEGGGGAKATAGTANTGGGGGGANSPGTSEAGGSGIVIIRYKFQ